MSKNVLFKPNVIINSKYEIDSIGNRLFNCILFNMQRNYTVIPVHENLDIVSAEISYTFLKKAFKNNISVNEIDKYLSDLQDIKVELRYPTGIKQSFNMILVKELNEITGDFNITIHKTMFELLLNKHGGGFSQIDNDIICKYRSVFSQRIYEMLRCWTYTKHEIVKTVKELKECFKLENKYKRYNDFKKYVILKSVEEINASGNMKIEFEELKKGRSVVAIKFVVQDFVSRKEVNTNINNNPTYTLTKNNKRIELNFNNHSEREYNLEELEEKLLYGSDSPESDLRNMTRSIY